MPFDHERLVDVGRKVRDLYPTQSPERMRARVTDEVLAGLATSVTGKLGGKVGVAPRIYLRKLVAGILDRVDLHSDFNPLTDFDLKIEPQELSVEEQAAATGRRPDDIEIDT
jgi:hypothetical protein